MSRRSGVVEENREVTTDKPSYDPAPLSTLVCLGDLVRTHIGASKNSQKSLNYHFISSNRLNDHLILS